MSPREMKALALSRSETSLASSSTSATTTTTTTTTASPVQPGQQDTPILAAARHLLQPNGSIVGSQVADVIEPLFPTLASALNQESHKPALASIDGRAAVSHARVHQFVVHEFGPALQQLGVVGRGRRPYRIALVLPNGPELALALVATAHWASAVPLNANGAVSELEADLQRCGADLVIGPYAGDLAVDSSSSSKDDRFQVMESSSSSGGPDFKVFRSIQESAEKLDIPFVGLVPSPHESGIFRLVVPCLLIDQPPFRFDDEYTVTLQRLLSPRDDNDDNVARPNQARDEVLVLFTSGTTGNKKLVPHQLGDIQTAATIIALSWNLTDQDVNCNLMPLFHVGGIVRQIFSPLVSGGCVICCPSFDPSIFWSLLAKQAFTWYYAAPTMHQVLLQTHDPQQCPAPHLRMIANAAGGLLPSLAVQLRDTFQPARVLPSYGMTECMPISSPPAAYDLTKPGTSGVAVGPEVAILNLVTMRSLPVGQEGPICVRGAPCFRGYGILANSTDNADGATATAPETFLAGGWFNTGDLGYLDEDGYLFITGRSKEVINRGGEIIPPMEVEEQVVSHPDVLACAAFSANHDVLQEVVGIVVVPAPGRPRIDLPSLHAYLGERLAAPKWPQVLVFLEGGLPKSHTNKLLRVKLGSRLGLPELNDNMTYLERTFEGACPPQGTALDVPIPVTPVSASAADAERLLRSVLFGTGVEKGTGTATSKNLWVVPNPTRAGSLVCYVYNVPLVDAIEAAKEVLDAYAIPTHFVAVQQDASTTMTKPSSFPVPQIKDSVTTILQRANNSNSHSPSASSSRPVDPVVQSIQDLFVQLLKLDYIPAPDSNFFHLGGSSMLASQLASKIRKQFGVPCSGAEIFHHANGDALAKIVRKRSAANQNNNASSDDTTATSDMTGYQDDASDSDGGHSVSNHGAPFAAKRLPIHCSLWAALVQLVPMFVVFPIFQVTRYLLFFALLLRTLSLVPDERDLGTFVLAYLAFHLWWVTVTPLVFVVIKWVVIGRYRAGRYPLWSGYYLRWWFVDVCRKMFLRGIWGSNEITLNFYYRMLGAKIGKNARISLEADIAEYDLVTIGRNAAVEVATVRGFGVDNGAMILGPVTIGDEGSVGVRSVVAPFTSVPHHCHLGPVTSTYDVKGLDAKHVFVNRRHMPEPSLWMMFLVGAPIHFLVNCVGQIPPLVVLLWMLQIKGQVGEFETPSDLMEWLCDLRRIPFYIGIRLARALLTPFFYMAAAIFVKKFIIGEFKPGPKDLSSDWQLMRHHLAATLFTRQQIQAVADIIGRHYELVSCLYRLLGAKVGKRVFWPGHQPIFGGEFDLLDIGDDVVFGSRSSIFCSTTNACDKVILCAGANVADNCVVLPGSIVGKNAVLGSNSVCPMGWYLPEGSVWFGSKGSEPTCLEKGSESEPGAAGLIASSSVDASKLQMSGDPSTLRPFGKAFYKRDATYFVWPLSFIVGATVLIKTFIAAFHALPLLAALQGTAAILYGIRIPDRDYELEYDSVTIYFLVLFTFFCINIVRVFLWLGIELTAKWTLMGRRRAGEYNYDTSSYAQRWELYQLIGKIRKFSRFNFLQFFFGTPYMSYYFRWQGGKVGKDCCLYPTGADPFMPEPDLVQMGNGCVIDCASIVCHLNTRGSFQLAKIIMEDYCTLRTRSRIQQGVYMETGSQLLEKSLAMTGEVIEAKTVWQGGPASLWFEYSKNSVPFPYDDHDDDSIETNSVVDETSSLLRGKTSFAYGV